MGSLCTRLCSRDSDDNGAALGPLKLSRQQKRRSRNSKNKSLAVTRNSNHTDPSSESNSPVVSKYQKFTGNLDSSGDSAVSNESAKAESISIKDFYALKLLGAGSFGKV
jgi:hypothetical protein